MDPDVYWDSDDIYYAKQKSTYQFGTDSHAVIGWLANYCGTGFVRASVEYTVQNLQTGEQISGTLDAKKAGNGLVWDFGEIHGVSAPGLYASASTQTWVNADGRETVVERLHSKYLYAEELTRFSVPEPMIRIRSREDRIRMHFIGSETNTVYELIPKAGFSDLALKTMSFDAGYFHPFRGTVGKPGYAPYSVTLPIVAEIDGMTYLAIKDRYTSQDLAIFDLATGERATTVNNVAGKWDVLIGDDGLSHIVYPTKDSFGDYRAGFFGLSGSSLVTSHVSYDRRDVFWAKREGGPDGLFLLERLPESDRLLKYSFSDSATSLAYQFMNVPVRWAGPVRGITEDVLYAVSNKNEDLVRNEAVDLEGNLIKIVESDRSVATACYHRYYYQDVGYCIIVGRLRPDFTTVVLPEHYTGGYGFCCVVAFSGESAFSFSGGVDSGFQVGFGSNEFKIDRNFISGLDEAFAESASSSFVGLPNGKAGLVATSSQIPEVRIYELPFEASNTMTLP